VEVLEHGAKVGVLHLQRKVGTVQRIETAETALDLEPQVSDRGLDRHADVPPGDERVQGSQLTRQRGRIVIEPALPGDRQQAGRSGLDGQRLEEHDAVRRPGLAISDPHVVELAVLDEGGDFGGSRAKRVRLGLGRSCLAEHPVALAVGVLLQEDRDIAQLERSNVHRPRDQRPEADPGREASDLDHLRLRAPIRVTDADALGEKRDGRQHTELERSFDREGPADLLRDETLDAALVPAQVPEREVKHDREDQHPRDGKEDGDKAA
jgi:hypothetical protein